MHYQQKDFEKAIQAFKKDFSIENKPIIHHYLGNCYLELKKYPSAIIEYNLATNKLPDSLSILNTWNLARAYHFNYQIDQAIDLFNRCSKDSAYRQKAIENINACQIAKEMMRDPVGCKITNLGPTINTIYDDFSPLISADESTLIFTSDRPISKGISNNVFISHKSESTWSDPIELENVNTTNDEFSMALSIDGQYNIFYRNDSTGNGLMYGIKKIGTFWVQPSVINSRINQGPFSGNSSLSSDGKTIYFASKREGGYGGFDLYKSNMNLDGVWEEAINLGPTINTPEDDISPVIHPDNSTLYFSSKGYPTMGGFDLFRSKLNADKWETPENLGYPINTCTDDAHIVLSARGKNAYISSDRPGGMGGKDLYKIEDLPQPNIPLTMVRGHILSKAGELKNVRIKIYDNQDQDLKHLYKPNLSTGKYLMIFPPGKNYRMQIEADGFEPHNLNIYIPDQDYFYELRQSIYLTPSENKPSNEIRVENYFYDLNATMDPSTLTKDSILLGLIEKMIKNQDSFMLDNIELYASKEFEKYQEYNPIYYQPLMDIIEEIINKSDQETLKNLELITQNKYIDSKYISSYVLLFEEGNAEMDAKYNKVLSEICKQLRQMSTYEITVEGHSDNTGDTETNLDLSRKRTTRVTDFFKQCGIPEANIKSNYFGSANSLGDNNTNKGRELNRRVEIYINLKNGMDNK